MVLVRNPYGLGTRDGWGNPILYFSTGAAFGLASFGSDGKPDRPYLTDLSCGPHGMTRARLPARGQTSFLRTATSSTGRREWSGSLNLHSPPPKRAPKRGFLPAQCPSRIPPRGQAARLRRPRSRTLPSDHRRAGRGHPGSRWYKASRTQSGAKHGRATRVRGGSGGAALPSFSPDTGPGDS